MSTRTRAEEKRRIVTREMMTRRSLRFSSNKPSVVDISHFEFCLRLELIDKLFLRPRHDKIHVIPNPKYPTPVIDLEHVAHTVSDDGLLCEKDLKMMLLICTSSYHCSIIPT
jgi:hypothetical protein